MSRNPSVCKVCLGNAETTQHKCNGKFGDKNCNDWLWGWFVVDDTVARASRNRVANDYVSPNKSSPKLPVELIVLTDAYLADKTKSISVADDILRKWQMYYSR